MFVTLPVRVLQLSDTHFLSGGAVAEGMGAYDTSAAFEAVFGHIGDHDHLDLVVVTGDVADHGTAPEYEVAAQAFSQFRVPVNLCPGNHDFEVPFQTGFDAPNLTTERIVELGNWAFVFADSNAGQMIADSNGTLIDPPGEDRLHANGSLGVDEPARIRTMCEQTEAAHVFIWVHHPPGDTVALVADNTYTTEWTQLLADLPKVRGIGAGHTHVPSKYEFMDRPLYVSPAFKNNFDLENETWLPPGYRTYEFGADGSVTSEVHLVDDDRWPRRRFGRAIASLFRGEITHEQLAEIAARKQK